MPTQTTGAWTDTNVPTSASAADTGAVELGVRFRVDVPGYITGIRFYKGAGNTGTHVGSLWSSSGQQLASATFVGETATGWQQVSFATPVAIAANTVYVASYFAPNGGYAADLDYFATAGVDAGVVHLLRNGESGGNGVFAYGSSSSFPSASFRAANYWVDVRFTTSLGPDTTPPTVTAVTPAAGATVVPISTAVTATFSEALDATTVNTSTFELRNATTNALITSSVTYNAATRTATLTPGAALAASTLYTATLKGGANDPRVKDAAGNALAASSTWSFTTAAASSCPCSIWAPGATPGTASHNDPSAVTLGVKFRSTQAGYITGIRFYKGAGNTGTHVGSLWSSTGQQLASATFVGETATGWQQVSFATPVAIAANTVYVASYFAPNGGYAGDSQFFATASVTNGSLQALQDGTSGGNGLYAYASSNAFPNASFQATNYWVDVTFTTTLGPDTTPPTVTAVTPAAGATVVPISTAVTATFSEALDATTVNTSTFELRNATTNALITAAVTYNATSRTATLTPGAALAASTLYTATLKGGASDPRVKDAAGNALAASSTWSFTTAAASSCPCSIWAPGATPGTASHNDPSAVTLGVKFRSTQAGYITGIRFYKGAGNTGTHVGSLWSSTGQQLASATFVGETATGWQQVSFATPVAIAANTVYVASYFAPNGGYAGDSQFFATASVTNGSLQALQDGTSGGNGVYVYAGSNTFPNFSYRATNYWIDVVFAP